MSLPPPPAGTGRIVAEIDVNGSPCSVGFWVLVPNGSSAGVGYAEELADDFFLGPAAELVALMHSGGALAACSITLYGAAFGTVRVQFDPAHGPWTGGQAQNVALGIHWLGSVRGSGTQSVTKLPAIPDDFIDGNTRVSQIGYANLRDHGVSFMNGVNAMLGPFGGTLTLGTVHRVRNGAPIPAPSFEPFFSLQPSAHVCTLRRRLPRRGGVSSP